MPPRSEDPELIIRADTDKLYVTSHLWPILEKIHQNLAKYDVTNIHSGSKSKPPNVCHNCIDIWLILKIVLLAHFA